MMKGQMGQLMKQAQKMQEDMQKAQEEIANMEAEGQAGGGMVKAKINGRHETLRIEIDDSVMDDKEMLEDLICAALNDANQKLQSITQEKYASMTSGMPLPPGFKLPF